MFKKNNDGTKLIGIKRPFVEKKLFTKKLEIY